MLLSPEDQAAADARAHARRTRGHLTSYGEGRVCEVPDCETRLSRYNTAERCAAHDEHAAKTAGSSTRS
jgi:hypothetical protein